MYVIVYVYICRFLNVDYRKTVNNFTTVTVDSIIHTLNNLLYDGNVFALLVRRKIINRQIDKLMDRGVRRIGTILVL